MPASGSFYPPTLLTNVFPSSTVAVEEIFGPVLVSMTFRTPDEAVMLANHSRYGLAASVWSETIGLALDIAPKLKAGVVWINATNLFDASVGFGGYRESGFGREGGKEGAYAYLKPTAWAKRAPRNPLPDLPQAIENKMDLNFRKLIGRPSSLSAENRYGPMEITYDPCFRPKAKYWARLAKVIAKISAMRWQRHEVPKAGVK